MTGAAPTIDTTSYPKARLPIGSGYDRRPNGKRPRSIIVHTTNGRRGSSFAAEARFIHTSTAIGAHDLIGKRGQMVEFLSAELRAWHAGVTVPGFGNSDSIGIECHITPGEPWTAELRDALTWRVRSYMERFDIAAVNVETHRAVALPKGRKIDPSEWSDGEFYAWRAALAGMQYLPTPARLTTYQVMQNVNVREGPSTAKPVALGGTCVLAAGMTFESDVVVPGEALASGNTWVHLVTPAPWGFVHSSCVRRIT